MTILERKREKEGKRNRGKEKKKREMRGKERVRESRSSRGTIILNNNNKQVRAPASPPPPPTYPHRSITSRLWCPSHLPSHRYTSPLPSITSGLLRCPFHIMTYFNIPLQPVFPRTLSPIRILPFLPVILISSYPSLYACLLLVHFHH